MDRTVVDLAPEEALDALRASEQRFRATVDQLPDAVSVFESVRDHLGEIVDFRWVYCNAYNAEMTGYTIADLVGRTLLEVFPEQGSAGMIAVYSGVVESGESWQQPTVWYEDTWGDGSRRRRAFDVRASKVGDGFVVVSRDVTELRLVSASLEESSRTLRDLLGLVGHDLRNPLTVTLGFLSLAEQELDALVEGGPAVTGARNALSRAHDAALRVERLLEEVLRMSREEHASLCGERVETDLEQVVIEAVEDAEGTGRVLLSGLGGLRAWGDPSQLRQVLDNLLSNATKYGADPVSVVGERADGTTRLLVSDSGPGVPEDFAPRLFDRFSRAADSHQPGTGLGLHLARRLCRAMGGDLTYEPAHAGSAAVFVVSLTSA